MIGDSAIVLDVKVIMPWLLLLCLLKCFLSSNVREMGDRCVLNQTNKTPRTIRNTPLVNIGLYATHSFRLTHYAAR